MSKDKDAGSIGNEVIGTLKMGHTSIKVNLPSLGDAVDIKQRIIHVCANPGSSLSTGSRHADVMGLDVNALLNSK